MSKDFQIIYLLPLQISNTRWLLCYMLTTNVAEGELAGQTTVFLGENPQWP